jgi:pimeloyl-ACP methyl ester carboxylesterase
VWVQHQQAYTLTLSSVSNIVGRDDRTDWPPKRREALGHNVQLLDRTVAARRPKASYLPRVRIANQNPAPVDTNVPRFVVLLLKRGEDTAVVVALARYDHPAALLGALAPGNLDEKVFEVVAGTKRLWQVAVVLLGFHFLPATPPSRNRTKMAAVAFVIVLVHGNNGSASDWDPFVSVARQTPLGKSAFFFASSANEGKRTLVGVETVTERFVEELSAFINGDQLRGFEQVALYLMSHSLGGLITRCALPALVRDPRVRLWGFASIASPHLGVGRPGGSVAKNVWKFMTEGACENLYNQTGHDLLFRNSAEAMQSNLLARLADPNGPYLPLLQRFQHRLLVAAPFLDMLVPYSTASASPFNPYDEDEVRDTDPPCSVWGYSGFGDAYDELLRPHARADAKGRPEDGSKGSVELGDGWQCDRHRFVKWPAATMAQLRSVPFRRLDVTMQAATRFGVHDGYLKKRLRGVHPDSGEAGDVFLELLWRIVSKDAEEFAALPTE